MKWLFVLMDDKNICLRVKLWESVADDDDDYDHDDGDY